MPVNNSSVRRGIRAQSAQERSLARQTQECLPEPVPGHILAHEWVKFLTGESDELKIVSAAAAAYQGSDEERAWMRG